MDRPTFCCLRSRLIIYRISEKIKYSSQACISYRNCDRAAGIYCLRAPDKTVGRIHGNTSYDIVANLLRYLGCQLCAVLFYFYGIEKSREFIVRKADIQNRTDDLYYFANVFFTHVLSLL